MQLVTYRLADYEGSEMVALGAIRDGEVVRMDVSMRHPHQGLGSIEAYLDGLPGTRERAAAILADPEEPGIPIDQVRILERRDVHDE